MAENTRLNPESLIEDKTVDVETKTDESKEKEKKTMVSTAENSEKRKVDESGDTSNTTAAVDATAPKKAKIAMPPPVASSLMDVDKYELDAPLEESDQPSDEDVEKKIISPCLILFGLHPLIREPPLKKMCEDFGNVVNLTVRSAFANRYGHVEFETIQEAQKCYKALNGAKLLHKAILVQPGKAETKKSTDETSQKDETEKTELVETATS